jgi:hypothetical protein
MKGRNTCRGRLENMRRHIVNREGLRGYQENRT